MKTKERILEVARSLFNEYGVENVSLRRVADAMGISLGNLTYHFPKREEVVNALYLQLVERFDRDFENDQNRVSFDLESLIAGTYDAFWDYRFLLNDLVQIVRTHEQVRAHYRELCQRRESETLVLFDAMVNAGIMQPEAFPGQFRSLVMQLTILGNSYLPSSEFFFEVPRSQRREVFVELVQRALFPYLTERGRSMVQVKKVK